MRRWFTICVSVMVGIVVFAQAAAADFERIDPDDVPWKPDLGRVSTDIRELRESLSVSAVFRDDKMDWWKQPTIHVLIDTRRSSRPDYLISVFWKNLGPDRKIHCRVHRVTPNGVRPAPRIAVLSWGFGNAGPGMGCDIGTSHLRRDGDPARWRMVTFFATRKGRKDYAPGRGLSYPHL
jgi:hypothetical protein